MTVRQNKVLSTGIYFNIIFFSNGFILSRFLELVTIRFESILKTIVCRNYIDIGYYVNPFTFE